MSNKLTEKMSPREELNYYNKILNGKTIKQAKKKLDELDVTINNLEDDKDSKYIDFETKWFTLSYYGDVKEVEKGIHQVWIREDTEQNTLEGLEKELKEKNIDPKKPNEERES